MKIRILSLLFIISLAFNLGILVKVFWLAPRQEAAREAECVYDNWNKCSKGLKLDLSCQQVETLETYRKKLREQMAPYKSKLENKRVQLFRELQQETFDDAKINGHLQEMVHLQTGIQKLFVQHFFEIKKIFNNRQQEQFYFYIGQCLSVEKGNSYTDGQANKKNNRCGPPR